MERQTIVEEIGRARLALEAREDERSEDDRAERSNRAGAKAQNSSKRTLDPEVSDKVPRRRFSPKYKLKILREADRCKKSGEIGSLLRREGLFSSILATWRRQRETGELGGLAGGKRGRKTASSDKLVAENKRLRRETQRLARKLERAEIIIDIQKKASALLGIPLNSPDNDEND